MPRRFSIRMVTRLDAETEPNTYELQVTSSEHPYTVTIEAHGIDSPVVRKITVENPDGVSPRDVRRLPLTTYADAAVVYAKHYDPARVVQTIAAPRGRPTKGRSSKWYMELADHYRSLVSAGVEHPVKEIAKRKHVDRNTVDQWLWRARRYGFLEPSPRGKKGSQE